MKLSLRDLFWLVALVAMGCGWWVERRQVISQFQVADKQAHETMIANEVLTRSFDDLVKSINEEGYEALIDVHTGQSLIQKRMNE